MPREGGSCTPVTVPVQRMPSTYARGVKKDASARTNGIKDDITIPRRWCQLRFCLVSHRIALFFLFITWVSLIGNRFAIESLMREIPARRERHGIDKGCSRLRDEQFRTSIRLWGLEWNSQIMRLIHSIFEHGLLFCLTNVGRDVLIRLYCFCA